MKNYILPLIALGIIFLVGCSGDLEGHHARYLCIDHVGVIRSTDRLNIDGSYGDIVHFRALNTGTIVVHMLRHGHNSVQDPYIVVWRGYAFDWTTNTLIDFDDDSGRGRNAYLRFYGHANHKYSILFTTYGPRDFGYYRYVIKEKQYDNYRLSNRVITQEQKITVDVNSKLQKLLSK